MALTLLVLHLLCSAASSDRQLACPVCREDFALRDAAVKSVQQCRGLERGHRAGSRSAPPLTACAPALLPLCSLSSACRLPCLHVFHGVCIKGWLKERNLCPLCRYALPSEGKKVGEEQRAQAVEFAADQNWWL